MIVVVRVALVEISDRNLIVEGNGKIRRIWRNSMMTSFAGIKSWNFCGRSGVNSANA
jgi:hypothetical protein